MSFSIKSTATKSLALALAASFMVTTALPVTQAEAGHRKHWKNSHNHHKVHRHHKKRHKKHRNRGSSSDALAAGIIGFAIGAIIADQATRPRTVYVQPEPVYRQPLPVYTQPQPVYREPVVNDYNDFNSYDEPQVIRYEDTVGASYEPWSQEWARWCDNKYRSFNVRTGTFRGYDGRDHFCVVK